MDGNAKQSLSTLAAQTVVITARLLKPWHEKAGSKTSGISATPVVSVSIDQQRLAEQQ